MCFITWHSSYSILHFLHKNVWDCHLLTKQTTVKTHHWLIASLLGNNKKRVVRWWFGSLSCDLLLMVVQKPLVGERERANLVVQTARFTTVRTSCYCACVRITRFFLSEIISNFYTLLLLARCRASESSRPFGGILWCLIEACNLRASKLPVVSSLGWLVRI